MLFHVSKSDESLITFISTIPNHLVIVNFEPTVKCNYFKYENDDQIVDKINKTNVRYVGYSKDYENLWKSINFIVSFSLNTNTNYSINLSDKNTFDNEKYILCVNSETEPLVFLRDVYSVINSTAYYNDKELLIYIGNKNINNPVIMKPDIIEKSKKDLVNNIYKEQTVNKIEKNTYNICLVGDWISTSELRELWSRYCMKNYTFENIKLVNEEDDVDFYVIINRPNFKNKNLEIPSNKCIVFHMEPNMLFTPWYTDFLIKFTSQDLFFKGYHKYHRNNIDWHLSKTFEELVVSKYDEKPKGNTISMIMSNRRDNIGHVMRLNLTRKLDDSDLLVDIYGKCQAENYKNYRGELEYYHREQGLIDYKYHFMAENTPIENYFTEKIVDCILSETLCFYWGCPNIDTYIDEKCYIRLPLNDIDECINIIRKSIENNEWEKRIDFIRREKQKILHIYSLMPRLQSIIHLNMKTDVIMLMKEQDNEVRDKLVDMSFKNIKMKKVDNVSISDILQLCNYAVSNKKDVIGIQSKCDNILYSRVCDTLSIIKHANIKDKLVFCYKRDEDVDIIFSQDFYVSYEAAESIMKLLQNNNVDSLTKLFDLIKPARIKYIY
jgi:hypothetical protein